MTAAQDPPPTSSRGTGWTARGAVVVALMLVLAAVLVLSHVGISAAILGVVAGVAVVTAVVALAWLPRGLGNGKEARDD